MLSNIFSSKDLPLSYEVYNYPVAQRIPEFLENSCNSVSVGEVFDPYGVHQSTPFTDDQFSIGKKLKKLILKYYTSKKSLLFTFSQNQRTTIEI